MAALGEELSMQNSLMNLEVHSSVGCTETPVLDAFRACECGVERRREPRISTDDSASMHVLNPLLEGRQAVRVLDASRNGLKLSSLMDLQRGTLIQVYIGNIVAMGEVRYCSKCGGAFHLGIQLDNVFPRQPDEEPWNEAIARQS